MTSTALFREYIDAAVDERVRDERRAARDENIDVPAFVLRNHIYYTYRRHMTGTVAYEGVETCVHDKVRDDPRFADPPGFTARDKVAYYTAPHAARRQAGGRIARAGVVPDDVAVEVEHLDRADAAAEDRAP